LPQKTEEAFDQDGLIHGAHVVHGDASAQRLGDCGIVALGKLPVQLFG
jgi:hypothetical protein